MTKLLLGYKTLTLGLVCQMKMSHINKKNCLKSDPPGYIQTRQLSYRTFLNVPKFLDRQVWANSVDPIQTAPIGAVWSGSTLFAIPSASFRHISLWKIHMSKILGL